MPVGEQNIFDLDALVLFKSGGQALGIEARVDDRASPLSSSITR